jgi:hypothetical protein
MITKKTNHSFIATFLVGLGVATFPQAGLSTK